MHVIYSPKRVSKIYQVVWQDDISRRGFATAVFFWLASLSVLIFFYFRLPPQVPLFYSLPWGEDQLAPSSLIFAIPGSVFLIILINLLAASFFPEEKLLLRTLGLASAVCAFLGLFALIKIITVSL